MLPITVHVTPPGPNPWKVVLLLEELSLPYKLNSFSFEVVKRKPFTDINPNGRVPAIEDPNTGITLWESGAIIQYIIEQYDTAHSLSHSTLKERHLCNQWLAFQISGQGPYFGQAGWFMTLHPEKLPSAIDRYVNELKRVLGVLDGALATGNGWLVGDKMTFADLSFTLWNDRIGDVLLCPAEEKFEGFPNVEKWHERMTDRPAWKKVTAIRTRLMAEQDLQWNGIPNGIESFDKYEEMIREQTAKELGTDSH